MTSDVVDKVLSEQEGGLSNMKNQSSDLNLKLLLRAPYVTPLNALQVRPLPCSACPLAVGRRVLGFTGV
jgi:hypothetical protein